jgi:hypothetical protein
MLTRRSAVCRAPGAKAQGWTVSELFNRALPYRSIAGQPSMLTHWDWLDTS